jgi:alginate O-acetyltransferase complex protein AlgI
MLFNSFDFFVLVSICFLLYYFPRLHKLQIGVLITASFIFYGYAQPILLILLIASISVNAVFSYLIAYNPPNQRKIWATIGIVINLGVLLFFKYAFLIGKSLSLGGSVEQFLSTIPLPVGISFFTFQGISLLVDVFRERRDNKILTPISKNFGVFFYNIMLFKSFFPQLVAGPIVKAHDFLPYVSRKYFKDINWNFAVKSLIIGYFLKTVIADNLQDVTFWIAYPYYKGFGGTTLLTFLFGYSMQIFADFAGYSLIALGISALFGYKLLDNFMFPYVAISFSSFWRRWHISLSSFLKEYLYVPLGGNQKGKIRTYLNLMIVMFLGGLWHGAAWSYAVWGTFHGGLLALERLFKNTVPLPYKHPIMRILGTIIVFVCVSFAWLLFKLPKFEDAVGYMKAIFSNKQPLDEMKFFGILVYSIPVILYHFMYLIKQQTKFFIRIEFIGYALMLFFIITNSGNKQAFIYFQF